MEMGAPGAAAAPAATAAAPAEAAAPAPSAEPEAAANIQEAKKLGTTPEKLAGIKARARSGDKSAIELLRKFGYTIGGK